MTDYVMTARNELPKNHVFQPSRAEIAREMRCRLRLNGGRGRDAQPEASRH